MAKEEFYENDVNSNDGLELIKQKIFELRGLRVMLDYDLAELYRVETRALNQAVKRNIERFPDDFMFRITATEWNDISSQIVMRSRAKRPKSALPMAFTEHGALMLASVLRSSIAVDMSIKITRAFVAIRHALPLIATQRRDPKHLQCRDLLRPQNQSLLY